MLTWIILEDYWSPGRVIDTYYDVLPPKDIKYIETMPDYIGQGAVDRWIILMRDMDLSIRI